MEKGNRINLRINDMSHEGTGIGKSEEGLTVFVTGAIWQDHCEAEITKVKKSYALAKLVQITKPSQYRIETDCEYADVCGGCAYRNISYEGQLLLKQKQLEDKLVRLGGIKDPKVNPIQFMEDPYRYRNKGSMKIDTGGIITRKGGIVENLGEVAIGFNEFRTNNVVDCYDCKLQSEPAMAAVHALRQFMIEDNITAYDPKWDKGLMKHIVVKTAMATGEVMVILAINGKGIPNHEKLVDMLDDAIYYLEPNEDGIKFELASVILNIGKGSSKEILSEDNVPIAGKHFILEEMNGLKFEISPLSFYQVNKKQTIRLYEKALEYSNLTGKETVLDLYCGVGTIGIFAAKKMEEISKAKYGKVDHDNMGYVYGVESVKGAVLDANRNAVINGIANIRFITGKAEQALPIIMGDIPEDVEVKKSLLEVQISEADIVFVDPPRAGCDEHLLNALVKLKAKKIVYVSCDPSTLARDVKFLVENGYQFKECTPVDMFPWTNSIESVSLLERV